MYDPQAEVKKPNIYPKQNSSISSLLQFCYFYAAEFLSYHGVRHHLSTVDQEFNLKLTHSRQRMREDRKRDKSRPTLPIKKLWHLQTNAKVHPTQDKQED